MRFEFMMVAAAFACCMSGCRTTKEVLDDYERNLVAGSYQNLPGEVAELATKGDDTSLLWNLLAGSGYYLSGDHANTLASYDAAESAMQKNDSQSVFSQSVSGGLAMMTNDRAFPYDGGGQDRIFTCLYKAIDYIGMGEKGPARTELNRAVMHQENWLWERRKDIDAAAQRLSADSAAYEKSQNVPGGGDRSQQVAGVLADASFAAQIREKCAFDPASSGDLSRLTQADYFNAYAQHVCGVFRWVNGDGGRASLKAAASLASATTASKDFQDSESGVKPRDQVWIWVEDGLCPTREEWKVDLPLMFVPGVGHYLPYTGMAFPVLRERTWGAASWTVRAGGVDTPMAELANVDKLVKTEYDVYMRGALTRQITRTIVLAGVQIALGAAADNTGDRNHQLALKLSQLGVAAWAKTSTAADLRSWTALPKTVKAVRIPRPADGMVQVIADNETVPIQIPAGGNTMVFIRKPAPGAPCVVKTATFAAR